jgi:hypothetical protein
MKLFIYKINVPDAGVENTVLLHIIFCAYVKNETGSAEKFICLKKIHGSLKNKDISFIHKSSYLSILKH